MDKNQTSINSQEFIRAIDYVVHNPEIELAHFNLADTKPIGCLTKEPCYSLFGQEKGANISKMFDLVHSGEKFYDDEINHILYLSQGWNRQVIPESAFDTLRLVVETYVDLQKKDGEISDWYRIHNISPKNEKDYKDNIHLQLAQKKEDKMDLERENTLAHLRSLEQKIVNERGFDLNKYPTIDFGKWGGNSIPYKMDHVMDEVKVHAIEYYFNPNKLNKMVFDILKPLHNEEAKRLIGVLNTYAECDPFLRID